MFFEKRLAGFRVDGQTTVATTGERGIGKIYDVDTTFSFDWIGTWRDEWLSANLQ